MQLLLTRNVMFGTHVVVIVHPDNTGRITIPSVEEGKVERRNVSADTVGLQPLNVRSPLFQCVPSRRGGPWRCVTTVRWDVLGSFAVWITCEAKLELGDWHLLVASQLPDSESCIKRTRSCSSWRRATPGKRTSCARCYGMKRPETSSYGSVTATCIGFDVFTWAVFETVSGFFHSHAA